MIVAPGQFNVSKLASAYARIARELGQASADFDRGAHALENCRWEQAEHAIRRGLDRLGDAIKSMPQMENYQ